MKCDKCDEEVTGPDEESVKETMQRHKEKKHGSFVKRLSGK